MDCYTQLPVIPIGHANGWLSSKGLGPDLSLQAALIKEAGDDAIEITWKEELIGQETETRWTSDFRHVSMHLPSFEVLSAQETTEALTSIVTFSQNLTLHVAVSHPPSMTPELYRELQEKNIPVTIENMDRDKENGYDVDELRDLHKKHNAPFCLDLQHAYEWSTDTKQAPDAYAKKYLEMMTADNALVELHVSGEDRSDDVLQKNHTALHRAQNKDEIADALRAVLEYAEVPIILEGDPLPETPVGYQPQSDDDRERLQKEAITNMREEREWLIAQLS